MERVQSGHELPVKVDWPGAEFLCACNGESLRVCLNDDGEVELSFWSFGFTNGRLRWRDRPRWLWKVLTRGLPFADQIILGKDESVRLSMLLNQAAGVWTISGGNTGNAPYYLHTEQVGT